MRYLTALFVMPLCAFLMSGQVLAQVDVDREGNAAQPTAPRVGPESAREEPAVRETRRRGAEDDENGNDEGGDAELADEGTEATPELQTQLYHVELPDVDLDDVVRAAHVLARANAAYAEHRADLMRAALDGDDAAYAAIQRVVAQETEAAAREAGIDLETYERVLRSVQQHALVSQRFFATLEQDER